MFDKTYVTHEHNSSPSHITVNEHKAPTDESVRLLNEMQDKAIDNIIKSVKVDTNVIKCEVLYFQNNMPFDSIRWVAIYELNGKRNRVEGEMRTFEFAKEVNELGFGADNVARAIFNHYSRNIVLEFFKQQKEFLEKINKGLVP